MRQKMLWIEKAVKKKGRVFNKKPKLWLRITFSAVYATMYHQSKVCTVILRAFTKNLTKKIYFYIKLRLKIVNTLPVRIIVLFNNKITIDKDIMLHNRQFWLLKHKLATQEWNIYTKGITIRQYKYLQHLKVWIVFIIAILYI